MKKKTVKKITKQKRVVHGPEHDCPMCNTKYCTPDMWGKNRNMLLMLAAGTIILVVAGMYIAGWL